MASESIRASIADPAAAAADRDGAFRVGRNFSFRFGAQVVSAVINIGGVVLLGNALSASQYGSYAFYYALISVFASVADGGVGLIVTREIARDRAQGPRLLGDGLLIKGALSILLLIAVAGFAWVTMPATQALLLVLVTATALVDFGQDPSVWVLRAHERFNLEAGLLIVSQFVWLGVLALCLMGRAGLPALLGAAALAFTVRMISGAVTVARLFYRPVFRFDRARLKRLLLMGLPFGAAMFGVVLYGRVGLLMLKGLSTPSDVAYFNVSYLLSQPFGFIASALAVAAFPLLSRHARRGEPSLQRALRRTYKFQVLLTPALTVGLFLLAEPIIAIMFPKGQLQPAASGLRIMSFALTLIFLNLTSRYVLTALDRQAEYLKSIVAGLIASVGLSLILIPPLGFVGACLAVVGGEFAIWLVCHRALARYLQTRGLLADLWRPLLAALGMGIVVYLTRGSHLVVSGVLGGAIYVALLLLLRAVSSDELHVLRRLYASTGLPGARAPRPELRY